MSRQSKPQSKPQSTPQRVESRWIKRGVESRLAEPRRGRLTPSQLGATFVAGAFLTMGLGCFGGCSGDSGNAPVVDASPTVDSGNVCPTHLDFESIGEETRIDIGYSGLLHGGSLPSNTTAVYEIDDCDSDCRRCSFSGPVRSDPDRRKVIKQRCINDQTKTCETDAECGTGATAKCRFQLRALSNNSNNQCSAAYFEPVPGVGNGKPVQGVYDLSTGAATFSIANLVVSTYGGGVCDTCENDNSPFDGNAMGTCSISGGMCDVSGTGGPPPFTTSFDCPLPGPIVASIPLPLTNLGSDTRTWSIGDPGRADCTADVGTCWCGLCEDFVTACDTNSECSGIGTGQCGYGGVTGMEINSRNNLCDTTCDYNDATNSGTCTTSALGPPMTVPCFPKTGTITAEGGAEKGDGFFVTTLAGLDCYGAGYTSADAIFGLPGILYVRNVYRVTPRNSP